MIEYLAGIQTMYIIALTSSYQLSLSFPSPQLRIASFGYLAQIPILIYSWIKSSSVIGAFPVALSTTSFNISFFLARYTYPAAPKYGIIYWEACSMELTGQLVFADSYMSDLTC